jgi:GNAT superfamily N-acetyltransferase
VDGWLVKQLTIWGASFQNWMVVASPSSSLRSSWRGQRGSKAASVGGLFVINACGCIACNVPDQRKKSHCRVYYAVLDGTLAGFYSLAAASRNAELISKQAIEYFERISHAPCLYLGMIGVQEKWQANGIGKKLMIHAMETTAQVAELVGIYALILQAADAEVGKRYKKWDLNTSWAKKKSLSQMCSLRSIPSRRLKQRHEPHR